ncbi:MAG: hypothetical protein D6704_10115 [Nitrospirae bacterium]|nr:MAG: hypothetical protein D6704_10115 [Nitrospirota bacterium]
MAAIEVKNSPHIHPQDLRGLKTFKEDYPQAQCFLLYRGRDRIMRQGIHCIPCAEFLRDLHPKRMIGD